MIIKLIVLVALGYAVALLTRKYGFFKSRRARFRDFLRNNEYDPFSTDNSRLMFYIVWISLFFITLFIGADIPYFIAFSIGTMICVIITAISDIKEYLDNKNQDY